VNVLNNKEQLFPNINHYKVDLEKKYLVRQNIFVLSLISLIGILSIVYLALIHEDLRTIIGLSAGFLLIIVFNISALAYSETHIEFLKFNKFITSIGFFSLMIIYVLLFQSPSFIPFIFLAYLIAAVYKDIKVLSIISLYFILTMIMLLVNYGNLFDFQFNPTTNNIVIGIFVVLFLSLLMISTYITIKESQFFYNQISFSKEKECRNLEMLTSLKSNVESTCYFYPDYYETVKAFFESFTKKINTHNVFNDKVEIIKMLSEGISKDEILKKYTDMTVKDVHRLESLIIKQDTLLRKISMHIFYYNQRDIHEKEIFSETHFESFDKSVDDIGTKIVAFSVFYVLLKKGLPGTKPLSKDEIDHILIETDFYHSLHPKIRLIYQENSDVFEAIYNDVFDEVVE
jgi:hypothetical protein